jgi:hypothetical protein
MGRPKWPVAESKLKREHGPEGTGNFITQRELLQFVPPKPAHIWIKSFAASSPSGRTKSLSFLRHLWGSRFSRLGFVKVWVLMTPAEFIVYLDETGKIRLIAVYTGFYRYHRISTGRNGGMTGKTMKRSLERSDFPGMTIIM